MTNLDLFESVVASVPEIERKGKTTPYTSASGYMFSFLDKEGLVCFRLPKHRIEELIEAKVANTCYQHGRLMKDFVSLEQSTLESDVALALFKESYEHTLGLKPKKK